MATQISQPLNQNLMQRWLEPRATNRDEAFRERIIRAALGILIIGLALNFVSSIVIFQSSWSLISFPSLYVLLLFILVLSGLAITNGYLLTAGWLLIVTVMFGASGMILLSRQESSSASILYGLATFMLVPLVASLVLPRALILWVSFLAAVVYALAHYFLPVSAQPLLFLRGDQEAIFSLFLLLIEGALLQRLRLEFDLRLDALRESLRTAEQSRQQAETARQQAEYARAQAEVARKRAEEADKAKTHFLANMSHELRTPLNAIIGYDEAMLGGMVGTFTPDQSKLLRHIQHNSRRLLGLINDILDLSKIESGSVEVYLAPISPQRVIEQTVDGLQALAIEKSIDLKTVFADSVPGVVLGDTKKLQQILVNLIGNAIKFTEKGGVVIEVGIVDKDSWQFEVRDTGIGMPEESLPSIFEPFQQIDNTSTRKYKGTGLGLSITKRLVEKLDGSLTVKSKVGEGSSFTVQLPRASVPQPDEVEVEKS